MQIDPVKTYRVVIETNKGGIELELYPQHAPNTAENKNLFHRLKVGCFFLNVAYNIRNVIRVNGVPRPVGN